VISDWFLTTDEHGFLKALRLMGLAA